MGLWMFSNTVEHIDNAQAFLFAFCSGSQSAEFGAFFGGARKSVNGLW